MAVPGQVENPERLQTERITLISGGDEIEAYLARPDAPGLHPGLIVIHEAFGPVEHIHDIARRFANLGYAALAPNLYSRAGAPDPTNMQSVLSSMFGLSDAQVVADLVAASDYLTARDDANGKVGCIGFCSGGRQTLLFACSSDKVDAAVDCWGGFVDRATQDATTTPERPVPPLDLIRNLRCPLLAVFGAEDQNPSPAVAQELRNRALAYGKDVTVNVYQEAGHAFFADYRPSYRETAAFALWPEIVSFFEQHLM
jgi:carboxymethylenebutenolidase